MMTAPYSQDKRLSAFPAGAASQARGTMQRPAAALRRVAIER